MEEIKQNALYETKHVARIFNVSVFTILRYIRDGKIQAKKVGRAYKIMGEWITDYIESLPNP